MEKVIVNEKDIPKIYLNGVWEKEIYIDEENLHLHPGMDQPGYKTYTYIDTAQTQWEKENPKKHILKSVENSLKNLNTDYIDCLLLHRPSPLMDISLSLIHI